MRRFLPLFGVIVIAVVAASAGGAATPAPSIHLSGRTLTGAHFLPLKTLKVTVTGSSSSRFLAKPARNGTFHLPLGFDPLSGCGGNVKISVSGPRGEAASLSIPKALCPGGSAVGVSANGGDGSSVSANG